MPDRSARCRSNPVEIGFVPSEDARGVQRIAVQDTLVATAGKTGVGLYNFSDPQHPEVLGRFESEYVEGIFIHGQNLYIAEGTGA